MQNLIKDFRSSDTNIPPTLLALTATEEPHALLQITGVPSSKASEATAPQPSCLLGKTKQSVFLIIFGILDIGNIPKKNTCL